MIINNLIKLQNKLYNCLMQLWNSYKLKSYGKQIKMSGGGQIV